MRRIIGGDEIAQKIEEIEEIAKENFEAVKEKETEKVVDLYKGKRAVTAFQRSKHPSGIPPSFENALIAVDMLGAECRYDVFHDRIIVKGHECGVRGDAHENLENITLKVRQTVLARFGFDPSTGYTMDAIKARCLDNIFDPVRDYLDGLQWDRISRIDDWLVRYCGAQDTLLN